MMGMFLPSSERWRGINFLENVMKTKFTLILYHRTNIVKFLNKEKMQSKNRFFFREWF